jgi:hypothetical protein
MFQCNNDERPPSTLIRFITHTMIMKKLFTKRSKGCIRQDFIDIIFGTMERNIERAVKRRMQPGYKKEVGGQAKVIVGCLQENQWQIYKAQWKVSSNPPKPSKRSFKVPGFHNKVREHNEILAWDCDMPAFSHKRIWWVNKWIDQLRLTWRAWLYTFAIRWNSYTGAVSVVFEYCTQFYSPVNHCWQDV